MHRDSKIINLVPASGWKAIYDDHGQRKTLPLVAWALVESEEGPASRSVMGLVLKHGVPTPATEQGDFKGYEQPQEKKPPARRDVEPKPEPSVKEDGASLWFA